MPPIGTSVMDWTPPAMATSTCPSAISAAAMLTLSSPEEQNRFTVMPGTLFGSPASRTMFRPTLSPCSPSGMAQPNTTSPIRAGSRFGAFVRSARITAAPRSSGRVCRKVPRLARPPGVRSARATTTSRIAVSFLPSVAQRLAGLQDRLHPLEALALPAQPQERFALPVEHVLRGYGRRTGDVAAAEDPGQLPPDLAIVLGDVAALLHVEEHRVGERETRPAHHRDRLVGP